MSRIESGKIDLISENVSLSGLIEDVMDVFRPLAAEEHLELQINADHVRHEKVIADQNRLRWVPVNLLSNAIKYTLEGGSVGLRVCEIPAFVKGKGQYGFIVTDNGIGMSGDLVPHISEPSSRTEKSKTNQTQGVGLGTAITQSIVSMVNGAIEVRNIPGEGSQFIVAVSFRLCKGAEDNNAELSGLPVFVMDDDQVICESAAEILDDLGVRSNWVLSGRETIRRIVGAHEAEDDFFSLILDRKIPGMDGLEALKATRGELGVDVPIIVVSIYDYSEVKNEFRMTGTDAFITKPLFRPKIAHTFHQSCWEGRTDTPSLPGGEVCTITEGKRVLLVEDNRLNHKIAMELLEMHGSLVNGAENGRLAVEESASSEPEEYNRILMDIQMPVTDGCQASEAIRALTREDTRTVPTLALTANTFATDIGKIHCAGVNNHMAGPIEVKHLMGTLRGWIGQFQDYESKGNPEGLCTA